MNLKFILRRYCSKIGSKSCGAIASGQPRRC